MCAFCDLDGFRANSTVLLENELCLFANEETEVLYGSGIIVPKAHRATVFDLTVEEFGATRELLLQARAELDNRYHPDGFTIGLARYTLPLVQQIHAVAETAWTATGKRMKLEQAIATALTLRDKASSAAAYGVDGAREKAAWCNWLAIAIANTVD